MFRGNHPARVDEKGRLKMPAEFKRRVDEVYGPQFFITSRDGKRAEIYPMKEWEKIEDAIAKAPASGAKRKFLDVTNYYGQMVEMDGQGRVLGGAVVGSRKYVADISNTCLRYSFVIGSPLR